MSKLSRRQFTAATASGFFLAAAPRLRAQSPNEKLGVCIVGVNSRGNEHIRGFDKDPRTEIRAIVDIDESVGQQRVAKVKADAGQGPRVL